MSDYFERAEAYLLNAVERQAIPDAGRREPQYTVTGVRWPSRWMAFAAGSLASVGAVVALALALTAGTSPSAYAVVVHPDGSVTLTVEELVGVGPANARLAELGVRARLARREPGCTTKARPLPLLPARGTSLPRHHGPDTPAIQRKRLKDELRRSEAMAQSLTRMVHPEGGRHIGGVRLSILPSAIPRGDTLLLVFRLVTVSHLHNTTHVPAIGGTIGLYRDPAPRCLPTM